MKDYETARQGAQNLTTRTSVKTPSSMRRAAHEAGEDEDHVDEQNDWPANDENFDYMYRENHGSLSQIIIF